MKNVAEDHIAKFPLILVLKVGDQHRTLSFNTRQEVISVLTKFANRLSDPSERGMLLMWLGDLSDPLTHYNAIAAAGWRVSISGELGATIQESLAC
jgi:hypothetical protein